MAKKKVLIANINWSRKENKWILRLADGDKWLFSKSWGIKNDGIEQLTGEPIDWVHDSILCEIAHLQDLGYQVTVTV